MSKFHIESSQVIRAPPERVFAAVTDFESHTRWDKTLRSCRVVKRDGNVDWCEVEVKALGVQRKGTAKHTCFPTDRIDYELDLKGGKAKGSFMFERAPEGTTVRNVGDVDAAGALVALLRPLARRRLESGMREWGRALAAYVESLNQSSRPAGPFDVNRVR